MQVRCQTRGPFIPLLFCTVKDVLSRGLSRLIRIGALSPMSGPRTFSTPSHVLYADGSLPLLQPSFKSMP